MPEQFKPEKVGLIVNPNAKRVKRQLQRRKFFWKGLFDESLVEITPDITSIAPTLKRFKARGIDVLGVFGGDGTLMRTATAAFNVWGEDGAPPFLVLKGGTANALIKNMGVRRKAGSYARLFWKMVSRRKLDKMELREAPMLKVEEKPSGQTHYGFIFANGLVYRSTLRFQSAKSPGAWHTLKEGVYPIVARAIGTEKSRLYFERPVMKIDIDDKYRHEGPVIVTLLSTLKKLILWYEPFSGDIMDTNGFYGLMLNMEIDDMFANFIPLARGRYEGEGAINDVLHDVRINTNEGYMLDGELFVKDFRYDLRITRGPLLKVVILPII